MLAFFPEATIGGKDRPHAAFFASYSRKNATSFSVLNFLKLFRHFLTIESAMLHDFLKFFSSSSSFIFLKFNNPFETSFILVFLNSFFNALKALMLIEL